MRSTIYAAVQRDPDTDKKKPRFGETWGKMARREANTRCRLTGAAYGLTVVDYDSKDMDQMDPKLRELLGDPTMETFNGYHWYFNYVEEVLQTQGLFAGVDVRNDGGLVFDKYWGDDKTISYTKVGEQSKMSKKLRRYLVKHSQEREVEVNKQYAENVSTDEPWDRVADGEQHQGLRILVQESFKRSMTRGEVEAKHLEYIDRFLVRDAHELSLMESRLSWAESKFAKGGQLDGEALVVDRSEVEAVQSTVDVLRSLRLPWYFDHELLNTEGIIAYVRNSAYRAVGSRFLWLSSSGNVREFVEKDTSIFWKDVMNNDIKPGNREEVAAGLMEQLGMETTVELWKHIQKKMSDAVKFHNQYETIRYQVDPFGENGISFMGNELVINTNKLITNKPERVVRPDLVADYKAHFPQLDDVLEWLVAVRFGADRKQSYLWMHCGSDWGKSFLFNGILGDEGLGIVAETTESELKTAMSGSPSGLTAETFTKAWVLFIDEFRSAVAELKQITHNIHISPKNKPKTTVNVYAKIFASAESVDSLEGVHGTDTQFINRFCKFSAPGSLVLRDVYHENRAYYKAAIRWYCYEKLEEFVAPYLKLTKMEAADRAMPVGDRFREQYKIEAKDLNTSMEEVRVQYMTKVHAVLSQPELSIATGHGFDVVDLIDLYDVNTNKELVCLNIGKAKEHYIYHMYDPKEARKVGHKNATQCVLGDHKGVRSTLRRDGVKYHAYKINY